MNLVLAVGVFVVVVTVFPLGSSYCIEELDLLEDPRCFFVTVTESKSRPIPT